MHISNVKKNKCVNRTDTNSPFAFDIALAFSRAQVSRGFYRGTETAKKVRTLIVFLYFNRC